MSHVLSADLTFVDAQAKATVRIMTHPNFEQDIAPVRSIVREWNKYSLTTFPTDWPFPRYHTQALIQKVRLENKGYLLKMRLLIF